GLLFFPSTDFSKSLLVGVILDKSNFNEIFSNYLMFWSFLTATLSPLIAEFLLIVLLKKEHNIEI
ncbi:MAG: sodium:solute symporter, partial [Proteobacteria bacterium]|nr:sodium:solute symporter [Candidatus Fonsibacter sp. PEL4]